MTSNNLAAVSLIVAPADLRMSISVSDNTPDEGQTIDYTVIVLNDGPSLATGIVIRDLLPATMEFVSANPDVGSYNATTGLWTLNTTLLKTQSKKIVIKAKPKAGHQRPGHWSTRPRSTASTSWTTTPPTTARRSTSRSTPWTLQVTVAVSDNTPDELQVIDYTVTAKNNGPSFASGHRDQRCAARRHDLCLGQPGCGQLRFAPPASGA